MSTGHVDDEEGCVIAIHLVDMIVEGSPGVGERSKGLRFFFGVNRDGWDPIAESGLSALFSMVNMRFVHFLERESSEEN